MSDQCPSCLRSPSLPVEQVRALVRLLGPEEMTPTASRLFEQACRAAEEAEQ